MYRLFLTFIATVFGVGFLPLAPGTWGSLVGVALAWFVAPLGIGVFIAVGVALFALGVFAADRFAAWHGAKDPQVVVIDEVVGMWIALWWLPSARSTHLPGIHDYQLVLLGLSFAVFRFFDVKKYWLAGRMEALPGGWGIVMDDVVAGLYAALCLLLTVIAMSLWLGPMALPH